MLAPVIILDPVGVKFQRRVYREGYAPVESYMKKLTENLLIEDV